MQDIQIMNGGDDRGGGWCGKYHPFRLFIICKNICTERMNICIEKSFTYAGENATRMLNEVNANVKNIWLTMEAFRLAHNRELVSVMPVQKALNSTHTQVCFIRTWNYYIKDILHLLTIVLGNVPKKRPQLFRWPLVEISGIFISGLNNRSIERLWLVSVVRYICHIFVNGILWR